MHECSHDASGQTNTVEAAPEMGRTIPTTHPKIEGPRLAAESAATRRCGCRTDCGDHKPSASIAKHWNAGASSHGEWQAQLACGGHARAGYICPSASSRLAFWYHLTVRRRSCAWVVFQGHFHFGASTHDARGHPHFVFDRTFLFPL